MVVLDEALLGRDSGGGVPLQAVGLAEEAALVGEHGRLEQDGPAQAGQGGGVHAAER